MRVRYSFSSHRTRHLKNIRKQRGKFPDILTKVIKNSDIIVEVLDARFIDKTRNIEIEKEIKKAGKKIIYVFNKSDLTDKNKLKNKKGIFISCRERRGIKELRDKIKIEAKKVEKKTSEKFDKISVGVIGYPNTGKSSLINLLIGKAKAKTGADAGFTKGLQKLRLTPEINLLDSPGVIPEKEYSDIEKEKISMHTIVGGRSSSQVKNPDLVVSSLIKEYRGVLEKFYKINAKGDSEILIEKLGRKKGFLKKGDVVNEDKTARLILKDWQDGKIRV